MYNFILSLLLSHMKVPDYTRCRKITGDCMFNVLLVVSGHLCTTLYSTWIKVYQ